MNKRFPLLIVVCLFLSSLLLASCSASSNATPTVTLDSEKCTYNGPKTVPADLTIDWIINDDTVLDYAYVIVTLDKNKSLADLTESLRISPNPPGWLTIISRDFGTSGNTTQSKVHTLSANASYNGEPIYIICFIGQKAFVVAGPLKVKE